MHYYQHHIGDFIRDTSRLSDAQSMAYLRLLWLYYESEEPLPANTKVLALRIGSESELVDLILESFFKRDGDVWKHKRCDAQIAEYTKLCEKNKENGKLGGRPKTTDRKPRGMPVETERKPTGLPLATDTQPSRNPNQYPQSIIHNPLINTETTSLVPAHSEQGRDSVDNSENFEKQGALPRCPTEQIVELYHKHLPMLPRVEVMNDTRRRAISARWRDVITDKELAKSPDKRKEAIDFFDWYFEHASRSSFLTGRAKNWRADFDFLTTSSKFTKVVEGHYHKEAA